MADYAYGIFYEFCLAEEFETLDRALPWHTYYQYPTTLQTAYIKFDLLKKRSSAQKKSIGRIA